MWKQRCSYCLKMVFSYSCSLVILLILKIINPIKSCICNIINRIAETCIVWWKRVQSVNNRYAGYSFVQDEDEEIVSEIVTGENSRSMAELRISLEEYKRKVEILENEKTDVSIRLKKYEEKVQILTKEKWEALTRLSELMGNKLRDNNPAITNLNDPNRPMKLGEQFSELYENEWTDAYSAISESKNLNLTERETIDILLNILKEIYQICYKDAVKQIEAQKAKVTDSKDDDVKVKELVKNNAPEYIPVLCKKIRQYDSTHSEVFQYMDYAVPYIERCVQICYLAIVQHPPMYIDFEPGQIFDKQCFKEYTKSGSTVDFIVWPALFLYKGGPILGKGVVQPKDTG